MILNLFLVCTLFCRGDEKAGTGVEGITLSDPKLKVELLDSHPDEFFLSHDMDLAGRLYLGAREGVFLYDRPAPTVVTKQAHGMAEPGSRFSLAGPVAFPTARRAII